MAIAYIWYVTTKMYLSHVTKYNRRIRLDSSRKVSMTCLPLLLGKPNPYSKSGRYASVMMCSFNRHPNYFQARSKHEKCHSGASLSKSTTSGRHFNNNNNYNNL